MFENQVKELGCVTFLDEDDASSLVASPIVLVKPVLEEHDLVAEVLKSCGRLTKVLLPNELCGFLEPRDFVVQLPDFLPVVLLVVLELTPPFTLATLFFRKSEGPVHVRCPAT